MFNLRNQFFLIMSLVMIFTGRELLRNSHVKSTNQKKAILLEVSRPRKYSYVGKDIKINKKWDDFRNYKLPTMELIETSKDLSNMARFSRHVANRITACLTKNLCEQIPDKDSPYFDYHHTEAHDLLERALSILVSMKESGHDEYKLITQRELLDILKVNNESVQSLAIELLTAKGISDDFFEMILGQINDLHPDAIGSAYAILQESSQLSNVMRDKYLLSLKKSFKLNDGLKVVNLARALKNIQLEKDDLLDIARASCTQKSIEQNYRVIKFYLQSLDDKLFLDKICT